VLFRLQQLALGRLGSLPPRPGRPYTAPSRRRWRPDRIPRIRWRASGSHWARRSAARCAAVASWHGHLTWPACPPWEHTEQRPVPSSTCSVSSRAARLPRSRNSCNGSDATGSA
jgi:hypothetical protein